MIPSRRRFLPVLPDNKNNVRKLEIGKVFLYEKKGKRIPVYIEDGEYTNSNYWYWRKIRKDGSLGRLEHGYNNEERFFTYKGKYKIRIELNKKS